MDRTRIIVLVVAAVAAGAVALLARSLLGGGTPATAAAVFTQNTFIAAPPAIPRQTRPQPGPASSPGLRRGVW